MLSQSRLEPQGTHLSLDLLVALPDQARVEVGVADHERSPFRRFVVACFMGTA
jgi:hypothetical protein